jgi:GH15 family glucan-1,4-alpha-glucosidase
MRDTIVDASSCYGVFEYGVVDCYDERLSKSFEFYTGRLKNNKIGGCIRYEGDRYRRIKNLPSNPWFITTLWLAEYYICIAKKLEDLEPAKEIFKWVTNNALDTGVLSEQLNPENGLPISVAPLTWSHAGFVIAINKYLHKLDELGICKMCNPPKLK